MAEQTMRSVCPLDCPDACGMLVTVRDGVAVRLRGDPEHPFTRGFLCGKVSHELERVYHTDRLKYPMRRVGPKGPGNRFERVTWDQAIDEIARRFRQIAESAEGKNPRSTNYYMGIDCIELQPAGSSDEERDK